MDVDLLVCVSSHVYRQGCGKGCKGTIVTVNEKILSPIAVSQVSIVDIVGRESGSHCWSVILGLLQLEHVR